MSEDSKPESVALVEVVPGGPVRGKIQPPGSKSLTNRALICAAAASGPSTLAGALRSEDTEVMVECLRKLGTPIEIGDGGTTLVIGDGARASGVASDEPIDLYIANSGTSIRFLAAMLSARGGRFLLRGVPRMHQRPIGDLVRAIEPVLDGKIEAESPGECPPVRIAASGWNGADVRVAGSVSSQYLSGLMMAAPIASAGSTRSDHVRIHVTGELVSRPYIDMTAAVMRSFGATVSLEESDDGSMIVRVGGEAYRGTDYPIEPDASAASYFWAAAAMTGGEVKVEGLTRDAMQGDVAFCDVLRRMGCDVDYQADGVKVTGGPLRGVDVDMNAISDTVQTLAVVALFAEGPTRVRGVGHNRFKETDRIGDLAREIRKVGAGVDEHEDGLTIHPPAAASGLTGATLETYHDHRMAMSLSLIGLRVEGVRIKDPACTSKTYPDFFADLEALTERPHIWTRA